MYGLIEIKQTLKSGVKIADIDNDALSSQLDVYLKYVYNDLGHVPHADDIAYIKMQLIQLLRNKYYNLRTAEVGIAFRNGVQEVYGKYYGINFVSLTMFLKAYRDSEERCEAVKQVNTETRSSHLLSAPEQQFDGDAWVKKIFAEYEQTGTCTDHGNLAYDYLNKNGKIDLTIAEKAVIWEEAKRLCAEKIEKEKAASNNFYQFKELEKKLIEVLESNKAPAVVVKAKQLALIKHFETNKY